METINVNLTFRLLLVTFLESFATICVERGVYFYSSNALKFQDIDNLWLALAFGAAYVVGALSSHPLSRLLPEKRLLLATLAGQCLMHLTLTCWPTPTIIYVCSTLLGFLNGAKWPVLESYISAGKTPKEQSSAVGQFNVAWALSVPLALFATGPMLALWLPCLFLVPAIINIACLFLSTSVPLQPAHLPHDHVERPTVDQTVRLNSLLVSNRWMMLISYAMMFLLAPLLPGILKPMCDKTLAPAISGLMDVVRVSSFFVLGRWTFWHGRSSVVLWSMLVMPLGFFMILFGGNLPVIIAGELFFGIAAGTIYYGALYYAMVVKNASVEGGGAHEGLIGLGFVIGPAIGLVGIMLQSQLHGDKVLGNLIGVGPILLLCTVAAILPLWKLRRSKSSR